MISIIAAWSAKSVGAATALPFRLKRGGCPSHKNAAKDPRKRKQG